jgi:NADH-quinone oxidoreductase subunit M
VCAIVTAFLLLRRHGLAGLVVAGIALAWAARRRDDQYTPSTAGAADGGPTRGSGIGLHYALGVDGLGLLMVLLTVCWSRSCCSPPGTRRRAARGRRSSPGTLLLEAFSLAVFAATDVFLFYIVFEATLIPRTS